MVDAELQELHHWFRIAFAILRNSSQFSHVYRLKNMYHTKNKNIISTPTTGMYCLNNASKLIFCARFLYLIESLRKLDDKSLILSNESPR